MQKCLRCDGALEKGFILDKGHSNITSQASWASGAPSKTFWRLTAVQKGARMIPIVSYRCKKCGRLESFAEASD